MESNNAPIGTSNDKPTLKTNYDIGKLKGLLMIALKTLGVLAFFAFLPVYFIFWIHPVKNLGVKLFSPTYSFSSDSVEVDFEKLTELAEKEMVKNRAKLNALLPKQAYIIINLTENKFWLYNAKSELVREGVCSTGSQITLDNGVKQWTFKTPKGVHKIIGKTKDPVWTRPDWAYIEEGLPVPGPRHPSRYEYGVLGDYALHMGDGYMIHGTIYQRFLGSAVTHGCVRLGDKELEDVFKTLVVGSRVFVY